MQPFSRGPGYFTFRQDGDFKVLTLPVKKSEYPKLMVQIREAPEKYPVIVWRGVIIDGYDLYEICKKENLPFTVTELDFEYKEEAVAWVCASKLKRKGLTEEARRFLIGLQYEAEKILTARLIEKRRNDPESVSDEEYEYDIPSGHKTAQRIAAENYISWNTVHKYSTYAKAILDIGDKVPEAMPRILMGRYKISFNNMIELAKRDPERIRKVIARLEEQPVQHPQYKNSRYEIQNSDDADPSAVRSGPSIKDMPEYDPDAEITALTLTIPTWTGSIDRIQRITDMTAVSVSAKGKLRSALIGLLQHIEQLLSAVKETNKHG